jgi:hypothetical protein
MAHTERVSMQHFTSSSFNSSSIQMLNTDHARPISNVFHILQNIGCVSVADLHHTKFLVPTLRALHLKMSQDYHNRRKLKEVSSGGIMFLQSFIRSIEGIYIYTRVCYHKPVIKKIILWHSDLDTEFKR